jgi:hypothetical protein
MCVYMYIHKCIKCCMNDLSFHIWKIMMYGLLADHMNVCACTKVYAFKRVNVHMCKYIQIYQYKISQNGVIMHIKTNSYQGHSYAKAWIKTVLLLPRLPKKWDSPNGFGHQFTTGNPVGASPIYFASRSSRHPRISVTIPQYNWPRMWNLYWKRGTLETSWSLKR